MSGAVLDFGRLPVVTALAAIGLGVVVRRARCEQDARALCLVFAGCLLLSFGPTTLGPVVDVIPGHQDLFFRRFLMGVQLIALVLSGVGAAWLLRAYWALAAATARRTRVRSRHLVGPTIRWLGAAVALSVVLSPAWSEGLALDRRNAGAISAQRKADSRDGAEVDGLIKIVRRRGGGRIYAGTPTNWGADFTVGQVPVFKYMEARDVDEVGYTLRTASLMTDPEYYFDERDPADYVLFGVRYLILPIRWFAPVRAVPVMVAGDYRLWQVAVGRYIATGRVIGALAADRTNVGHRSVPLLRSRLASSGEYLATRFGAARPLAMLPALPSRIAVPKTRILHESARLTSGVVTATTSGMRASTVVLSASFDPGWNVTVDGVRHRVFMVAPALVGATVPPGTHAFRFRYSGFADYPLVGAISGLALLLLLLLDVQRRSGRAAAEASR